MLSTGLLCFVYVLVCPVTPVLQSETTCIEFQNSSLNTNVKCERQKNQQQVPDLQ